MLSEKWTLCNKIGQFQSDDFYSVSEKTKHLEEFF